MSYLFHSRNGDCEPSYKSPFRKENRSSTEGIQLLSSSRVDFRPARLNDDRRGSREMTYDAPNSDIGESQIGIERSYVSESKS